MTGVEILCQMVLCWLQNGVKIVVIQNTVQHLQPFNCKCLFFNHPVPCVGDLVFSVSGREKGYNRLNTQIRSSDTAQERMRYGLYVQRGRK